jgi:metal-dependent amidase/aminoacylase/carboxypeptidase family protein
MLPDQRIHCAFLDTPKVANVIPDYTKAFWQVRSPTLTGLNTLIGKVRNCIEAGALATGCQVQISEYALPPVQVPDGNGTDLLQEMNFTPMSE